MRACLSRYWLPSGAASGAEPHEILETFGGAWPIPEASSERFRKSAISHARNRSRLQTNSKARRVASNGRCEAVPFYRSPNAI